MRNEKNIFHIAIIILILLMSVYFFIMQNNIKSQITANQAQFVTLTNRLTELDELLETILNKEEVTLKKMKIINRFGDTVIELSENEDFNGAISLFNKSKINTIHINGGNKNEHPGLLILKREDEVSFALMVQDKQNLLEIYNENGLDTVSLGTDEHGHGGYSIKNADEKSIKTEGWGWRAYKY